MMSSMKETTISNTDISKVWGIGCNLKKKYREYFYKNEGKDPFG